MSEFKNRFEVAVEIAREAGRRTLNYFRGDDLVVERKGDDSPITAADRDAEQFLRDRIVAAFPNDAIVGEEFSDREGTSGFRWILDPIDGTKSFIHGVPLYGALVAVEQGGAGVIGVIEIPALDERVYACRGEGAWHARGDSAAQEARVSEVGSLNESLLLTTEIQSFTKRDAAPVFEQLDRAAQLTRTWGDCFGYLMVATGRAEVMIDPILNLWDAAAVQPVVEEAGGVFADWRGASRTGSGDAIGANNQRVLDEVLEITRSYPALS